MDDASKEYIGVIGTLAGTVIGAFLQPMVNQAFNKKKLEIHELNLAPENIRPHPLPDDRYVEFSIVNVAVVIYNPNNETKFATNFDLSLIKEDGTSLTFTLLSTTGDINIPPKTVSKIGLKFVTSPHFFKFVYRDAIGTLRYKDSSRKNLQAVTLYYSNWERNTRSQFDQHLARTPETDQ